MNLMLSQTSPEDDEDTVNITVSWNEPPYSPRPNVSDYIIYHNVPDPDTTITTTIAPTTAYNIPDATVGSVYTVGVAAANVLGTGVIASATITIISTPSTPTTSSMSFLTNSTSFTSPSGILTTVVVPTSSSMTVSSLAMTVTPSVPSSSSSSMGATVTPSTSSPTSTAGGSNSTLYIGIGVGLVVFGIVILVLGIVGCLIWHKSCKGEKANFDQRRDSTEPIALVDKKDHGSSPATGQPIYQEAMSSEDIQREAAPTTGELYAQPSKGSTRRPPPQPQSELATYQDPSTIQRIQAPNMEYLYAEVDKSKPQQQQAVYAQVDKEKVS
ncbi:PREDICTED: mucin-2-like isoform X1 [Amphimedon queenslandica]|uniref:Fibronectin type-III domain-containing protein n=1 Tax=Amphimedon queenslandica TaxID=400682 RepID=A0AAN0K296_AMPQE|nr:PREDICTED: mucin-2-like isoform X1 [Amphimedon queenslandica]|eukprot:XP_019863267.1 PREDICTED: mucin-2-like isoform X1 [Amphimedon queenslandica]